MDHRSACVTKRNLVHWLHKADLVPPGGDERKYKIYCRALSKRVGDKTQIHSRGISELGVLFKIFMYLTVSDAACWLFSCNAWACPEAHEILDPLPAGNPGLLHGQVPVFLLILTKNKLNAIICLQIQSGTEPEGAPVSHLKILRWKTHADTLVSRSTGHPKRGFMASAWTVSVRRSAGWLGSVCHHCHTLLMGNG